MISSSRLLADDQYLQDVWVDVQGRSWREANQPHDLKAQRIRSVILKLKLVKLWKRSCMILQIRFLSDSFYLQSQWFATWEQGDCLEACELKFRSTLGFPSVADCFKTKLARDCIGSFDLTELFLIVIGPNLEALTVRHVNENYLKQLLC